MGGAADVPSREISKTVIGSPNNFWLWSPQEGFDLSHPATPDSKPLDSVLSLKCQVSNIVIDPAKTALIIIDLQNFALSGALNEHVIPEYLEAEKALLENGIPAARKAKIQIVWVNSGLTDQDMETVPPGWLRMSHFQPNDDSVGYGITFRNRGTASADKFSQSGEKRVRKGMGDELGEVTLENGTAIDAGRGLFKNTWNASLHDPLLASFNESQTTDLPDVLFHKNRNSGMCSAMTECTDYLIRKNIRTLLFAGMNTDQCVLSTLFDAQMKGFDTIMLNDGCATDTPGFSQQCAEFQCCRDWGFLTNCKILAESVAQAQS